MWNEVTATIAFIPFFCGVLPFSYFFLPWMILGALCKGKWSAGTRLFAVIASYGLILGVSYLVSLWTRDHFWWLQLIFKVYTIPACIGVAVAIMQWAVQLWKADRARAQERKAKSRSVAVVSTPSYPVNDWESFLTSVEVRDPTVSRSALRSLEVVGRRFEENQGGLRVPDYADELDDNGASRKRWDKADRDWRIEFAGIKKDLEKDLVVFSRLWTAVRYNGPIPSGIHQVRQVKWDMTMFTKDTWLREDLQTIPRETTIYEPIDIPDQTRFEHQFVVAPSGTGKTTLLQTQIVEDFERVARGECSVILMDSENELIPELARLAIFGPGGRLEGKLVLIEPDAEYPIALNLFDVPKLSGSANDIAEGEKEIRENILDCISAVNDPQEDLLVFLIEFCLHIPNANMTTMLDLLMPGGLKKYARYLYLLDETSRGYFESTFIAKTSLPTQDALMRRLRGLLREKALRHMFLQERSLFDIGKEIAQGKVIMINTKRRLLGDAGCGMLGRFLLSQLMQAAMSRDRRSLPVYCYVDECQNYLGTYKRMAKFLGEARKRRIGLIFITPDAEGILPEVWDRLNGVAIRFTSTGNEPRRGQFQLYVRYQYYDPPITVQVPADVVQNMPTMSDRDYERIVADMRARYCAPSRKGAVTILDPDQEPPPRTDWPRPPPGRVFDAEWWEVNDEPARPTRDEGNQPVRAALSLPEQRRLNAPDDLSDVPQPKRGRTQGRRRRR